jgi:hypothetical protein
VKRKGKEKTKIEIKKRCCIIRIGKKNTSKLIYLLNKIKIKKKRRERSRAKKIANNVKMIDFAFINKIKYKKKIEKIKREIKPP